MTMYRYPGSSIMSDYGRAGVGALLTWGPLTVVPSASIAGIVLSGLGVLFIFFAARTWTRSRTVVQLSHDGLTVAALRHKNIPWHDVESLDLRYFATKRDRSQGWMQLILKSDNTTVRLESTLDGFEAIARAAARAAARKGLSLSPSTLENLRALQLPTDHFPESRQFMRDVR